MEILEKLTLILQIIEQRVFKMTLLLIIPGLMTLYLFCRESGLVMEI